MGSESKETKLCKSCQTEIPKKAKVCPNCRKKQGGIGKWIAIAAVVIIVIAAASSGGSSSSKSSSGSNSAQVSANSSGSSTSGTKSSSGSKSSDNEQYTVGSAIDKSGLKITINSADLNFTDYDDKYGIYSPSSGKKYIKVSFTFENTSSSDKYVSIYDFDCYADDETCEQKYGLDDDNFINTNLSSGRSKSFSTYYEVPENAGSIELEYETSLLTSKKAVIKLQ